MSGTIVEKLCYLLVHGDLAALGLFGGKFADSSEQRGVNGASVKTRVSPSTSRMRSLSAMSRAVVMSGIVTYCVLAP